MLKKCSKCKVTKPTSEFTKHKQAGDSLRSRCRECNRAEAREFYKRKPDAYKKRARAFRLVLAAYLRDCIDQLKLSLGCSICSEKEVCCLDFHHVVKGRMAVAHAIFNGYSMFEREVGNCVLVCANCHRKIHAGVLKVNKSTRLKIKVKRFPQTQLLQMQQGVVPYDKMLFSSRSRKRS